jgi:hypothetical protein
MKLGLQNHAVIIPAETVILNLTKRTQIPYEHMTLPKITEFYTK